MQTQDDKKWISNFLLFIGSFAGVIAGIAAFFSLMGFFIILSFIRVLNIQGIPKFTEEFFKEAGMEFFCRFIEILVDNQPWNFLLFIGACIFFMVWVNITSKAIRQKEDVNYFSYKWKKIYIVACPFIFSLPFLVVTYFTLLMHIIYEKFREPFIYLVSIPAIIFLGTYLIIHIEQLARRKEWLKNGYEFFLLLFIMLTIGVPFNYGRYFYDMPTHFVNKVEYSSGYESGLMQNFRNSINRGKITPYFFRLGHTSENEVFIQVDKPPVSFILIDSEAVTLLGIEAPPEIDPLNEHSNYYSLRYQMSRKEQEITPIIPNELFEEVTESAFLDLLDKTAPKDTLK